LEPAVAIVLGLASSFLVPSEDFVGVSSILSPWLFSLAEASFSFFASLLQLAALVTLLPVLNPPPPLEGAPECLVEEEP
jgi:hypothetical protein